ncbi:NAD(P)-dependent oxidoreductase [Streptomyces sp. RTd22]|uniref:NAD(P)-dependent oxidoreductase n=1 Tax=Streptomyces sp. RTd22 TaxID=1841249 RepID=UPI0007C48553|nr:NAD(P)-dependent oxidoreductase [Streptomyces sp. RTd22]
MATIGFIGLGNMGAPMCRRLVEAGHQVQVFDTDQRKIDEAMAHGAVGCGSASCAKDVEFLLTSLPRPDHVEAVLRDAGVLAAMRPGSIWVDLTTNRKELVEELAAEAPEGVGVVDSPVTGAVDGARNGRLTLFAGGDPAHLERVTPLLETLGTVINCGGLGTGNVVKLVTNQLWFIASASIGEGFALGMRHGVDLRVLWSAIQQSVGDSFVARHDAPSIFAGHYDPSFTLDLCGKDLRLIGELQAHLGADFPLTDAARHAFDRAAQRYGPDAAELHVAKHIEDDTGLSFRLEGDWTPPWEVTDPEA